MTVLYYVDKTLLVLSGANSGVSVSVTTDIGASVGIASANSSLAFLIRNGIVKMSFETMERIKKRETLFYWPGVN